jgi:hypothetical protein
MSIFFLEEGLVADDGRGKAGKYFSVCKETIFIHQPPHEKRKSLSLISGVKHIALSMSTTGKELK